MPKTPARVRSKAAAKPRTPAASKPARRATRAEKADRHHLYQRAVQCVEAEIDFVDETFTRLRRRTAARLREDFCGTAATSCEWVRRRRSNSAVGLDLDAETLAWGRRHNLGTLSPAQRERLDLQQLDVLSGCPQNVGRFDCVLAMNFSYWVFKTRATMLAYFKAVRQCLADDGVFFLDFYGGSDALREMSEPRPIKVPGPGGPFTYVWQQRKYNPITNDLQASIHFRFPDGSVMRDAFTYDWRLWTLAEIRDVLADAGFARSTVYWEGSDGKGGGDGVFTASEEGEACRAFVCYLTAER